MKVTVIGGGNIGMCLAGEISRLSRYDVTIYTSHPKDFERNIKITDDERNITFLSGEITATNNIEVALKDTDIVLCTLPAFLRKAFIQRAEPLVNNTAYFGFLPGYGGAEFYCGDLIKKGVTIFALQKVPYVARTKVRGKIAGLMSKKTKVYVAAIPKQKTKAVSELIEDMLLIETVCLNNYMEATLLPGNPLLHTSGSYVYLKDYKDGQGFDNQIYYYQSWTDECSKVICAFSDEMMEICRRLPVPLDGVQSIQEYYESPTPELLTKKFHTIPSFYPLTLPMKVKEGRYYPDFDSRFYTEDIPNGVCIIKALAIIAKVNTPTIDCILAWYNKMTGKEYFNADDSFGKDINETAIPQLFGIDTPEALKEFYLK